MVGLISFLGDYASKDQSFDKFGSFPIGDDHVVWFFNT
jgi:hypothetical protein